MDRFCDYIEIYKHIGDIYNPFASEENGDIAEDWLFAGDCKAVQHATNTVDGECFYDIYINDNNVNTQARDTVYLYNNGREDDRIELTVVEVKRYERNTVIKAMQKKNGETA